MRLILCRHGCRCWHHLCLHSRDDGTKDDGHGNRQGRHADIRSCKEAEHHDPICVKHQKQNQKQKQIQQQWWQGHHLCPCRQLRPCSCHCCLCVSRGSSGGSTGVAVAAAGPLRVSYSQCTLRVTYSKCALRVSYSKRPLRVSYSQHRLCNHNPLQKS